MKIELELPDSMVLESVSTRIADSVFARLQGEVIPAAYEIRNEEIRKRIAPLIEEALAEVTFRTNRFGEVVSEAPRTLREIIVEEARLTMARRPSNSMYGKKSILEELVKEEVDRTFKTELRKTIEEEKAQVREAVRQKGAEFLAETLERIGGKV